MIHRLSSIIFTFLMMIPAHAGRINIIPQPLKVVEYEGEFRINANTRIVVPNDNDVKRVAGYLVKALRQTAGYTLSIVGDPPVSNYIHFKKVNNLGKEAYRLKVSSKSIVIESSQANGAFYGLQSLYQLLPPDIFGLKISKVVFSVPCCQIDDKPRFIWRGQHLDVCSHFFSPQDIKRYIDLIALHKCAFSCAGRAS